MTSKTREMGLVVVDVQRGFDDPAWGSRDNPACEQNIAQLIDHWRLSGRGPLIYVRHDSNYPESILAPGNPGNAFKDVINGDPDLLVTKNVHSAFHGSHDLAGWLRQHQVSRIAVCGITTNHCCETTTRVAADLGFDVTFVSDATHAFDRRGMDNRLFTADELHRATEANLHGEFAQVRSTGELTQ
jgi:nicotinamidase-related amidase